MDVIHERNVEAKRVNSRKLQWLVADNGTLQSEHCSCCIVEIPPGESARPPHSHMQEEEAIYVLEGRGQMLGADGEAHPVEPGSFMLMRLNQIHMLDNNGTEPLRAICFYSANTDVSKYTIYPIEAVGKSE